MKESILGLAIGIGTAMMLSGCSSATEGDLGEEASPVTVLPGGPDEQEAARDGAESTAFDLATQGLPGCIEWNVNGRLLYLKNHCGSPQRVQLILDFYPDTACTTLETSMFWEWHWPGEFNRVESC